MVGLSLAVFVSNCSCHPEEPRQWPSFLPLGKVPLVGGAFPVTPALSSQLCWASPMALAGPSCFCKAFLSLGILECGSVLPQIPVGYWLSHCRGWKQSPLIQESNTGQREASLLLAQTCTPCCERRAWGLRALSLPSRLHSCDAHFLSSSLKDVVGLFLSLLILLCDSPNHEKSHHFHLKHDS